MEYKPTLWTPYAGEAALDLSKRAATVEAEARDEPALVSPEREIRFPMYCSQCMFPSVEPTPVYAYTQQHFPMQNISPRRSPDSSMYGETGDVDTALPRNFSPETHSKSVSPTGRAPLRPFKAVTSSLPIVTECSTAPAPEPGYITFRAAMLEAMRARNGGSLSVSNPRMRRAVRRSSETSPDAEYLQRRARNNAAAKRSRDMRRMKEDELAIRTSYLEQENRQLRDELKSALNQLALYRSAAV